MIHPNSPFKLKPTGEWQIFEMQMPPMVILVHPDGRQCWFLMDDMIEAGIRAKIRLTESPFADLRRMISHGGLKPIHVDADIPEFGFTQLLNFDMKPLA